MIKIYTHTSRTETNSETKAALDDPPQEPAHTSSSLATSLSLSGAIDHMKSHMRSLHDPSFPTTCFLSKTSLFHSHRNLTLPFHLQKLLQSVITFIKEHLRVMLWAIGHFPVNFHLNLLTASMLDHIHETSQDSILSVVIHNPP